jgi:hypothetical protein
MNLNHFTDIISTQLSVGTYMQNAAFYTLMILLAKIWLTQVYAKQKVVAPAK